MKARAVLLTLAVLLPACGQSPGSPAPPALSPAAGDNLIGTGTDGRAGFIRDDGSLLRTLQEMIVTLQRQGVTFTLARDGFALDAATRARSPGTPAGAPPVVFMKGTSSAVQGPVLRAIRSVAWLIDPPGFDAAHLLPPPAFERLLVASDLRAQPPPAVPLVPLVLQVRDGAVPGSTRIDLYNALAAGATPIFSADMDEAGSPRAMQKMAEFMGAVSRAELEQELRDLSDTVAPSPFWPAVMRPPAGAADPERSSKVHAWLAEPGTHLTVTFLPHHMEKCDIVQPVPTRDIVSVAIERTGEAGALIRGHLVSLDITDSLDSPAATPALLNAVEDYLGTAHRRAFPEVRGADGHRYTLVHERSFDPTVPSIVYRRQIHVELGPLEGLWERTGASQALPLSLDLSRPPVAEPPTDGPVDFADVKALTALLARGGIPDQEAAARVWAQSWFGPDLRQVLFAETLAPQGALDAGRIVVHSPLNLGELSAQRYPRLFELADGCALAERIFGRPLVQRIVIVRAVIPNAVTTRSAPGVLFCQEAFLHQSDNLTAHGLHEAIHGWDIALAVTSARPVAAFLRERADSAEWEELFAAWRESESPRPFESVGAVGHDAYAPEEVVVTSLGFLLHDLVGGWPDRRRGILDEEVWLASAVQGCVERAGPPASPGRRHARAFAAAVLEAATAAASAPAPVAMDAAGAPNAAEPQILAFLRRLIAALE